MRRTHGRLPLSTIGVIFVVVFAGMYGGLQYMRGDLVPESPDDLQEQDIENAIWSEMAERWDGPDQIDTNRAEGVRIEAEKTAERLASPGSPVGPSAYAPTPNTTAQLPDDHGTCEQSVVAVTVPSGYDETTSKPISMQVAGVVAQRAVEKLRGTDGTDVLRSTDQRNHGIGVAIAGDLAYVVHRSCPS